MIWNVRNRRAAYVLFVSTSLLCTFATAAVVSKSVRESATNVTEWEFATTKHDSISIDGIKVDYITTAGTLLIANDDGVPIATMFYIAYTQERSSARAGRPVTFAYSGGPGLSSAMLALASIGPVRVDLAGLPSKATTGADPARLVKNDNSVLDRTDLVFIDAVGTGFSRPIDGVDLRDFCGIDQDIDSFARAISRWLTLNDRWLSPKFLLGESYGGTRSAGLAHFLPQHGVSVDGIILINGGLDRVIKDSANDAYYVALLPTYAATAWYHNVLKDRQDKLETFLHEVRDYANGPYLVALQKGRTISAQEMAQVAEQLSRFTGLPAEYVLKSRLRIDFPKFRKQLLIDENRVIGQLDTRLKGIDADPVADAPEFDPAYNAIVSALGGATNDYLRNSLALRADAPYRITYLHVQRLWDWTRRTKSPSFPWVTRAITEDLSAAMRENPQLRVLALLSYFDLAAPFSLTEYNLTHLSIDDSLAKNLSVAYYEAGHAIYMDLSALRKMKIDIARFLDDTVANRGQ